MTASPTLPFLRSVSNPGFVLDVAVPAAWAVPQQASRYADDVRGRLVRLPAIVPASWPYHLADVLLTAEQAGACASTRVDYYLTGIRSFPIVVDDAAANQAWPDTLTLARTHSLSVFDAAYIELALRLGLPLATLDAALRRAAAAAGVPIFVP